MGIEEQLQECAVTCLQSVWRGHAVRKSLHQQPPPVREPSARVDPASSGGAFSSRSFQQILDHTFQLVQDRRLGDRAADSMSTHGIVRADAPFDVPSGGHARVSDPAIGGQRTRHTNVGDGTWAHSLKRFGDASSPRPVLSPSPDRGRTGIEVRVYADVIEQGGNLSPPRTGPGQRVGRM